MARDHARIYLRIWSDQKFVALTANEQRAYLLVLSEPGLTQCGVGPLMVRRWARLAADTSERTIRKALDGLAKQRYLIIDESTEEVLVRSFMRNDKVFRQPNVARAAYLAWQNVHSAALRAYVLYEVHRVHEGPPDDYSDKTWQPEIAGAWLTEPLREPLPEGFFEGFPARSPKGFPEPPAGARARLLPLPHPLPPSPATTPSPSLQSPNVKPSPTSTRELREIDA